VRCFLRGTLINFLSQAAVQKGNRGHVCFASLIW
jgi:hypothetical protein